MNKFETHRGIVAPLQAQHVDTDQIIPKQFLKRIERTGYEDALFYDWRFLEDGKTPDPSFELNAERYQGASILLAGDNFGCGSSREHAPWALDNYGFRVLIAPSFADIFHNNCFNNGMLPITLAEKTVDGLFGEIRANEGFELEVDLPEQQIRCPDGSMLSFEIDEFKKHRLLNGLDQTGLTLLHEDKITDYESRTGMVQSIRGT
jgi:3-isopropylmalate/(R)-2-methylmalate dehydratase small subunit